jgi:tyrosyl-tRNA synthetase
MTFFGVKPNIAIILGILPGTDGVVKMSKSLGNHIPINTNAEDMYGKVMSIPDSAMPAFFRLVTRWTPPVISGMEDDLKTGKLHPRDAKMKLAFEVCASFYSDSDAVRAEEAFIRTFQQKNAPEAMVEFKLQPGKTVLEVLVEAGMVESKGEARRLMEQKGVKLDGEVLADPFAIFPHPGILQVGKRRWVRIVSQ